MNKEVTIEEPKAKKAPIIFVMPGFPELGEPAFSARIIFPGWGNGGAICFESELNAQTYSQAEALVEEMATALREVIIRNLD